MIQRTLGFVPLALLAGCAQPAERYPSLLPRAIESRSDAEPVRAAPAVAADPALDAKIAEVRTALGTVAHDADTALADRRLTAGAGAAQGSEPWLDAQIALAALDEVRARTGDAATDLEQLAIARAADGQPPYPALKAAQAEAQALSTQIETGTAARQAALR